MVLEIDNHGAVDLANNWSVGGRTRHIDVKNYFLHELKDQGILVVRYVPGDRKDADIFTKNTTTGVFERHIPVFVGEDEYLSSKPCGGWTARQRNSRTQVLGQKVFCATRCGEKFRLEF